MAKGRSVNLTADPHLAPQLGTNNVKFLIACTPSRCAKGQICLYCYIVTLRSWVHFNYQFRWDLFELVWTANEEFWDLSKVESRVRVDRSEELHREIVWYLYCSHCRHISSDINLVICIE